MLLSRSEVEFHVLINDWSRRVTLRFLDDVQLNHVLQYSYLV